MVKIEREIPIQIDPGENPFLRGIYAPISTEITADDLKVIGEIPRASTAHTCATVPIRSSSRAAATTGSTATEWSTRSSFTTARQVTAIDGFAPTDSLPSGKASARYGPA